MGCVTENVKDVNVEDRHEEVDMAASMSELRRQNSRALLRHALGAEHFTAAEAMAATGLTRATVLGLCDELTAAGWLEEIDDSRAAGLTRRGRPARRHRLRERAGILVGVDAGRSRFRVIAADLRGTALATAHRDLSGREMDRTLRIATVQELISEVLAPLDLVGPPLLTVVGIPAPVDTRGISPVDVSEFWRLMNPDFPAHLDGRVRVENDANLTALAEHARHHSENMAALLVGERIGAGLIVDGRLLYGARGGAGEMRFLDAVLQDGAGAEGIGFLARRWALEALEAGEDSPALAGLDPERLTAVEVFAAAADGDPLASAVLDRLGERVARIAATLVSLLGIERVVVAGAVAEAIGPVLERARATLPAIARAPFPDLVASALGSDVVVHGALQLALDRLHRDPLELLAPTIARDETGAGPGTATPPRSAPDAGPTADPTPPERGTPA